MSDEDQAAPTDLSSMFALSPWAPDYDVTARMWELKEFWEAGVTPALYDALKHLKLNSQIEPPGWILDASIKVVEDRLRAGFETKQKAEKRNDERKIYKSEIRDYYSWRSVRKFKLAGNTWPRAYEKASEELSRTDFAASPDTMKKRYEKVARDFREKNVFRYYSAMPDTRDITGTSLVPKGTD
jgi:hypothetical protein